MPQPLGQPRLYSYGACSTCRKALTWLKQQAIEVEVIDITAQTPSRQELESALEQLGRSRLFNTSGQSYRALGAAVVKALSDAEALQALADDGKLIKRPFLVTAAGRISTGFNPEDWTSLLIQAP
ncbi:MAG: Spx/MgsR family RNA polymerase-binding regulatory protein [Synechococcaceae cyanobacterium ELA263]